MRNFNLNFQVHYSNFFSSLFVIPITILSVLFVVASCNSTKPSATQKQGVEMKNDEDSTKHSLIVLDPGYESYLASQPSANFNSQQYFESWNKQYVSEWNMRHRSSLVYGSFYETEINYNPREDYGLELNYRLYYYFQFIKDKYRIVLINRGR